MAKKLLTGVHTSEMQVSLHRDQGFTLIEIMIVVSVIALLAMMAVPSFLRARKRSQAADVLNDLRLLDAALAQYAIDNNKATGVQITFQDLQPYLKKGGKLYNTGADIFGNDFGTLAVDSLPLVPTATWRALSDVADQSFWSPYYHDFGAQAAAAATPEPP
jgi:prepilin-type N-terminal cleavage/methylation domain-containing protein